MQDKRKTDVYVFCSVQFGEDSKSYYYIAEDDTFTIGDFVIVPVGEDGHSVIAEIVNIEYFQEDKVPFPLNKVKRVTRKCTDGDFDISSEAGIHGNESMEMDNINYVIEKQADNENIRLTSERIILCNEKTPRVEVNVWADLSEGCLTISGQDLGKAVMDFFGDIDYEYFYKFDRNNTERLFTLLNADGQKIKEVLTQKFGGMDGCRTLREFCDANNIKYSFFSY